MRKRGVGGYFSQNRENADSRRRFPYKIWTPCMVSILLYILSKRAFARERIETKLWNLQF